MKRILVVFCLCVFLPLYACGNKDDSGLSDELSLDQQSTDEVNLKSDNAFDESENQTIFFTEDVDELSVFHEGLIDNCYCKDLYRGGNHYYIDDGVLYGTGNDTTYGQLGIVVSNPTQISEPIVIAENVVHVDYSGEYFLIYLTTDHRLYGIGADVAGIFSGEVEDASSFEYDAEQEPVLLMDNVQYARCGSDTILILNTDGELFFYGNDNIEPFYVSYKEPRKIADDVIFMTTFFSSYAYITDDGSLYTFGSNRLGQCGTGTFDEYIDEPAKIADNVSCAWMGAPGFTHGEIELQYIDYLLIRKEDGSFWATGESIGKQTTIADNDGIPIERIAANKLEPVVVQQYKSLDLKMIPFGTNKEKVRDYLASTYRGVQDTMDDEGKLVGFVTNDSVWTFGFDDMDALVYVENNLCDSFLQDALTYGASQKQVEAIYGAAEEISSDEYGFEMGYHVERGLFSVRFYNGIGATQFRLEYER